MVILEECERSTDGENDFSTSCTPSLSSKQPRFACDPIEFPTIPAPCDTDTPIEVCNFSTAPGMLSSLHPSSASLCATWRQHVRALEIKPSIVFSNTCRARAFSRHSLQDSEDSCPSVPLNLERASSCQTVKTFRNASAKACLQIFCYLLSILLCFAAAMATLMCVA